MTDMDTDELIYLNRIGLERYGFDSIRDLKGRKCYEVLQNNHEPCSFCTNSLLTPGKFEEWRIYNPILRQHFLLKDTMIREGEKRYRVEIALDISESENRSAALQNYRELERVANEGIRHALEAPTPDECINTFLEYLGKALKGDRAYIFEKNEGGHDDNTYEWVACGIEPQIDNLQDLPPEVCRVWYRSFESGSYISIPDLENIREEDPEMYEVLKPQGIRSIVVVPIFLDREIIGFYGIDNPPIDALEYTYNMLNTVSHFFTSTMKRRRLVRQLQDLSHRDSFTMLGNRLAMREYMDSLDPSMGLAALYGDITGLKVMNDTYGHQAGDKLILDACDCLRSAFDKWHLFRIGGDELLVLRQRTTEEELKERTDRLREELEAKKVVLAVGTAFCTELSGCGADEVIKTAEKRMYEDKSRYYRENGLDRRKR
ncbi:MAG: diguanylate cyclase [Lachnospiraceae bacterium]|nr:diguanylate cyclase [Lachnospiraceae bacterium]